MESSDTNPLYLAIRGAVADVYSKGRYTPGPEIDLLIRAIAVAVDGYVKAMSRETLRYVNKETDDALVNRVTKLVVAELLDTVRRQSRK